MNKVSPFFIIGTTGVIVTTILHMFIALVLGQPSVHVMFIGLYPTFIAFLAIGAAQMKNKMKLAPVRIKR
ncbi:MAG: hypothetical protein EOP54_17780 [Sphingobacteriales bacterium]|nr:MAG: hypothetical protein EOP54_17780 [Sphingobacteriales bacterium]